MVLGTSDKADSRVRKSPTRFLTMLVLLVLPLAAPVFAQGPAATGVGSQFELAFWQSVESGSDPALYEAYLAQYPNGTFAAVARVKLAKLRQMTAAASAPVQAPAPAPAGTNAVPTAAPAPAQVVTTPPAMSAQTPALAEKPAGRQLATAQGTLPDRDAASDSAPYVTSAPPAETEAERGDRVALHRLLGALGDSQRVGAPATAPIADTADAVSAPPHVVEVARPSVAVPDAARLSATSQTPSADPRPIAVGPLPIGFALPGRPQLSEVPPLAFPPSFCSAEARNAFHDGPYVTAMETAKRNNDAAIAYMHQLQDLYDTNQLSGDVNPMNAVAAEARAYGPVAAAAFAAQSTLVSAFNALMAVPIRPCGGPQQP